MSYDSTTEIANRHDYESTISSHFNSSQSEKVIITPPSGLRIKCAGGYISTAATAGRIFVRFRDAGVVIADFYPNASQTVYTFGPSRHIGREDDPIIINTSTGTSNVHVSLNVKDGEEFIEVGTSTSTTTTTTTTTTTSTSTSTTTSTTTTSTSTTRTTSTSTSTTQTTTTSTSTSTTAT